MRKTDLRARIAAEALRADETARSLNGAKADSARLRANLMRETARRLRAEELLAGAVGEWDSPSPATRKAIEAFLTCPPAVTGADEAFAAAMRPSEMLEAADRYNAARRGLMTAPAARDNFTFAGRPGSEQSRARASVMMRPNPIIADIVHDDHGDKPRHAAEEHPNTGDGPGEPGRHAGETSEDGGLATEAPARVERYVATAAIEPSAHHTGATIYGCGVTEQAALDDLRVNVLALDLAWPIEVIAVQKNGIAGAKTFAPIMPDKPASEAAGWMASCQHGGKIAVAIGDTSEEANRRLDDVISGKAATVDISDALWGDVTAAAPPSVDLSKPPVAAPPESRWHMSLEVSPGVVVSGDGAKRIEALDALYRAAGRVGVAPRKIDLTKLKEKRSDVCRDTADEPPPARFEASVRIYAAPGGVTRATGESAAEAAGALASALTARSIPISSIPISSIPPDAVKIVEISPTEREVTLTRANEALRAQARTQATRLDLLAEENKELRDELRDNAVEIAETGRALAELNKRLHRADRLAAVPFPNPRAQAQADHDRLVGAGNGAEMAEQAMGL